ncbi:RNA polymerase I-specific transcription initiation factor rrn3 isoform X2 [Cornus florida]|uniref:RNA polymerase I-specific transcription initiation factor rrn3 isoform X2 n=1 Tax=Cornus florida TaxID=4283 RepID=UPI00289A1EC1|nr:RNA polymerase I-specific transcription initiation factor rrn3 isoform X2 [Cornus florida]
MGVELESEMTGLDEIEDVNFSDSELVYHVRDALRLVTLGDSNSYNQLIGVIHHTEHLTPDEVALLVTCLKALSGAVSCIDNVHHRSLLTSIFAMSLWNYGPDVMDSIVELVIALAASSGNYVDSCLNMFVNNFIPPGPPYSFLKQPCGVARKDQVLYRVHSALKDIADLVPLAPLKLQDLITERMPNIYAEESLIVIYIENMLRLESGAMGEIIGSMMLIGVVDRLIDLDIDWNDILQDDSSKGIFEMELGEMEGTAYDAEKDCDELLIESLGRKSYVELVVAEKLDSLMVLTFEHLKSCNEAGRLIEVFGTLLQSFQKTVLTVYKSKFAQFVMFYACSLDPDNCGVRFANMLADIFMGGQSPLDRMSAIAFLASYLSRAKFVSASIVAIMLKRLVDWCFEYCQIRDGEINPEAHRVFYSGCQAIMYVLCFRMRSIMVDPHLKSLLHLLPIEAILKHPLDPLKVCLPSIVEEFLRQAKAAHLFTISENFVFDDLLESEFSRAFGGMERLDMFFPFDPYLLKKSDRFIQPNFIYWSMVRTTYDDDDDDEEDSCDEDVDEICLRGNGLDIEDGGASSSCEELEFDIDEFDYALNKMSITPKNSLNYRFGGELQRPMQMPSRIRPSTSPESL